MGIRSFRHNFRTRGVIDPNVWNEFWRGLDYDLDDIAGSGTEPMWADNAGVPSFLNDIDVAVSGMAGRVLEE